MDLEHDEPDKIKELLVGRKVIEANFHAETLVLDNGTILQIVPNIGGCSCGSGDYYLSNLNSVDNIITDVKFDEDMPDEDEQYYNIFVYTDNERINLLTVTGDDGSGYYGTGFTIKVKVPDKT